MLYKKYHRNFVRQFKKGMKLEYEYNNVSRISTITKEPFVYEEDTVCVEARDFTSFYSTIVLFDGTLNKELKIV